MATQFEDIGYWFATESLFAALDCCLLFHAYLNYTEAEANWFGTHSAIDFFLCFEYIVSWNWLDIVAFFLVVVNVFQAEMLYLL